MTDYQFHHICNGLQLIMAMLLAGGVWVELRLVEIRRLLADQKKEG